MDTKENIISTDYIKIGEKTAFIKAADKLKRHRLTTIITITMLFLSVIYVVLLNKFFILLKAM